MRQVIWIPKGRFVSRRVRRIQDRQKNAGRQPLQRTEPPAEGEEYRNRNLSAERPGQRRYQLLRRERFRALRATTAMLLLVLVVDRRGDRSQH
jgi:hypothetical protein